VRQPHYRRGTCEKDPVRGACQGLKPSGTPGSHGENQLRLEADMGEFVGNYGSAENLQALAIGNRFERAIIDVSNQLGADEHADIEPQSGEPPHETKNPVGPIAALRRDVVILHESPQKSRVALLLSDKQFENSKQVRHLMLPRETFRRSQQRPPLGLFAELKCCDRARNELPFIGPQNIGEAIGNTARMQRVMFEMIQPDLEISGAHAASS
jgi:hypothetical protein